MGRTAGRDAWWNAWHLPGTTREHRQRKRRTRRVERQRIRSEFRDKREN